MKFRAGFRRVGVPTPTEYNLQYTWKSPAAPDHTPLLQAENLLNSQSSPSNYATNQQQPPQNGQHYDEGEEEEDFEHLELHEDPLHPVDGIDDSAQSLDQKANVNSKVPKLQLASDKNSPNTGKSKRTPHHCSSKATKKKPKSHHHHHHHASHHHASKKHKGAAGGGRHSSKVFVSEYKRQFKAWSVPSSTSGATKGKAEGNKKEKNEIGEYGRLGNFHCCMNHPIVSRLIFVYFLYTKSFNLRIWGNQFLQMTCTKPSLSYTQCMHQYTREVHGIQGRS